MLQFTPENALDFKRNKTLIHFSYGNVYDNPTFYNWLWDVLQCKQRTLRPVFHYLCFIHFGEFFFCSSNVLSTTNLQWWCTFDTILNWNIVGYRSVNYSAFFFWALVSKAAILGSAELFVKKGSDINLTCVISEAPESPLQFVWYHAGQVNLNMYPFIYDNIW